MRAKFEEFIISMVRALKNLIHLLLAFIANVYYRFPSRSMTMIGVTGTDGKTSTASLIYEILQKQGEKVALLTTVAAIIEGKTYETGFHVTTPSSFALQKYLKIAKDKGVTHFILETTSHGLDQNRVWGVRYKVSVITNISKEHLDYHQTYEKYVEAKAKIIGMSEIAVLNRDDFSYPNILELITANPAMKNTKVITFGLKKDADINPQKFKVAPAMPGTFNRYNSLASLAVCLELGVPKEHALAVISSHKPPKGRQDIVYKKDFVVMVDFAHTPNSFQNILSSVKVDGRLIHVFGSAGERDREKRPEMGRISSQYADVIVLTAEDPRSEQVEDIMDEIEEGVENFTAQEKTNTQFQNGKKYLFKIGDRKEAIAFAVSIAQKGDLVLITGKGHEQSMNLGSGEEPWSDFDAIEEVLAGQIA